MRIVRTTKFTVFYRPIMPGERLGPLCAEDRNSKETER